MARKSKPPCRWWESSRGFDDVDYFTECPSQADYHGPECPLSGSEAEIAATCWKHEATYCPFCGGVIDWCEENEVWADVRDDQEYREGVRYGLYGY